MRRVIEEEGELMDPEDEGPTTSTPYIKSPFRRSSVFTPKRHSIGFPPPLQLNPAISVSDTPSTLNKIVEEFATLKNEISEMKFKLAKNEFLFEALSTSIEELKFSHMTKVMDMESNFSKFEQLQSESVRALERKFDRLIEVLASPNN